MPKPAPKAFPVCTIRSTPSEPIHCIVWGKTYLFGKLFGEDDEDMDTEELDKAKASGENGKCPKLLLSTTPYVHAQYDLSAEEIENLKKEAAAFRQVRKSLSEGDGPRRVFHKIFNEDICRLLAMEDMWKKEGRVKPVPLDCDAILDGTFVAPPLRTVPAANQQANSDKAAERAKDKPAALLKDQKELSLKENLELFLDR